ncbi:MAG: aldehyde dehydrogenase family protein [Oligoflexales bacterium]
MSNIDIFNPYNLEKIGDLPLQTEQEVNQAIENAHNLVSNRRCLLPLVERLAILERTLSILMPKAEDLAVNAAREGGKPLVDSRIEIFRGFEGFKIAIEEAKALAGKEIPMGATASSVGRVAMTRREPRGLVVAVSAFNHPFNLIVHQVIPAVAVGCPVLVKPALTTPFSCQVVVEALYEAGLPKDWCRMIICDNDVAEKLVTDKRNTFLTFIGSTKVGWSLRAKLPPGALCALEHGGAAPVIVDSSADLDKAIPQLLKGAYYHAGQVCVSVQRIFVHESIAQTFCDRLTDGVDRLTTGNPGDPQTEVGPLILPREVDRVAKWVEEAKESGELLCGGNKISETCYQPSLILNPKADCMVSKQEIFGPVACVYTYKNIDEAIEQANNVDFAFQAAVFSRDLNRAFETARNLEGLTVMINDHTAFRVDWMPFGGYKHSGLGVGGIGHTMKDMTLEKMIVLNTN